MHPCEYGPHKTLYNRFRRWTEMGVFDKIFSYLTADNGPPDTLMIDATHLKAHRTASSLLKRGILPRHIGRTKGGLNTKLHAVCDGMGRPIALCLTAGQTSDHLGAKIGHLEERVLGASIAANFIVGSQVRLHRVTNACPQAYLGMILARISGGFRILNRIRLWAVVAHGKRGGGSCSLGWPW